MKQIKNYIAKKQEQFKDHPFFELIETNPSIRIFADVMPELSFWVMTFQDILRWNEQRVQDEAYYKIVHHHRLEDEGHELWFLHDHTMIAKLQKNSQVKTIDITFLFDKENTLIRDSSFAIASEAFRIEDDRLRVVLLLTLESTGHIFFEKISKAMKKVQIDHHLKYFSSFHLDVEKNHSCFDDDIEAKMDEIVMPDHLQIQAIALIDRVYASFDIMFNSLADNILRLPYYHSTESQNHAIYANENECEEAI